MDRRRALLLGTGALGVAAIAFGAYLWLGRPRCHDALRINLVNREPQPGAAELGPGDYTLEVVADGHRIRCRIHVRSATKHANENDASCSDDSVRFWWRAGQPVAFDVRGLPATLEVRLSRDGGAPLLVETARPVYPPTPPVRFRTCVRQDHVMFLSEARR